MHAFISYNKADKATAEEMALFLVAEGIGVWFDEWEIAAGDSIVQRINDGLRGCTHFLVVWSQHANRSPWVGQELHSTLARAISTGTPRVIPICLDATELPSLLLDIKHLRYESGTEADRREIVSAVNGSGPTQNFIKAVVKKYNEVIADPDDPVGVKACPRCGSSDLERSSTTDEKRDEVYFAMRCRECGAIEWGQ